MHREGSDTHDLTPAQTFAGASLSGHVNRIGQMIASHGATTLLDYGSGKGVLYQPNAAPNGPDGKALPRPREVWGIDAITCYDPGVPEFSAFPTETFDAVICIDVLEHIPEEDIGWFVDGLFALADKFVFAFAICFAAEKSLPNGENCHVTLKPPEWWLRVFVAVAERYPGLAWQLGVGFGENGKRPTKLSDYNQLFFAG